jgi:ubiquinol-cytochrome c reductase cytochrome b subunit
MARMSDWIESRLPARESIKRAVDESVPGGASYWYVFGGATGFVFMIMTITGIWQLMYYVPTTDHAYDSVNFLRMHVPFGWLIHGLHYWGAVAMVVLVLLHLSQVFIWGAFKKPRELTWLLGVGLFLATLGAVFTGGPLAWDEKGYWIAQVTSSIAGAVPLIGRLAVSKLWAGDPGGQLGLSRFFMMHVALVPIVIAAFIGLHLVTFRRGGAAGPFSAKRRERPASPFWPDQAWKDIVAMSLVFLVLVGLSAFLLTPVTGPADPVDSLYTPRPEWTFLWVFEIVKFLPGSVEWLGTVGVPLVGFALLVLVPWLDRREERAPGQRPVPMVLFAVIVAAVVSLSLAGAAPTPTGASGGGSGAAAAGASGATASIAATQPALPPPPPEPTPASTVIGSTEHGSLLFKAFCQECHGPKGAKGVANPGTDDGEVPAINPMDPALASADPQAFVDLLDPFLQGGSVPSGPRPKLIMPAFGATNALTQQQIADIEAYTLALNKVDRARIARPGIQPRTFFFGVLIAFAVAIGMGEVLWTSRKV